jgi:hypothetical protein
MKASELNKILNKYPNFEVTFCFLEDNKKHEFLDTRYFKNLDINDVEVHRLLGENRIVICGDNDKTS